MTSELQFESVEDRFHHRVLLGGARVVNLFRGGYTAGSLVAAIGKDRSLLLVKPSYRQGWGLPGGAMKRGEQSFDAVRRETLEETGIEIDIKRPHYVYVQAGRRHIDHLFFITLDHRQEPEPQKRREIEDAGWYSLADLPPLQVEACEALRRLSGEPQFPSGADCDGRSRRR